MPSFISRFICFCLPAKQISCTLSYMTQKIVIEVQMNSERCRTKALKIAAEAKGVSKVSIEVEKKQLEVIGNGVDTVFLAKSLNTQLGFATIVSVEEVKKPEKKEPTVPIEWTSSYVHHPPFATHYHQCYRY